MLSCDACGAPRGVVCDPAATFDNGDPRPMFRGGRFHQARVAQARRATMRVS